MKTASPPIAPYRKLEAGTLTAEHIAKLREAGTKSGVSKKSGRGCVVVLLIAAVLLAAFSVTAFTNGKAPVWAAVLLAAGAFVCLVIVVMEARARMRSPLAEFALTTHAYHIRSAGNGVIEVYCMPLAGALKYTNHYKNGIYDGTTMRIEFGAEAVQIRDLLDREDRSEPWRTSSHFRLWEDMIALAKAEVRQGRWHELPGADLIPGTPTTAFEAPDSPRTVSAE